VSGVASTGGWSFLLVEAWLKKVIDEWVKILLPPTME
jgi:hypothetical protein